MGLSFLSTEYCSVFGDLDADGERFKNPLLKL